MTLVLGLYGGAASSALHLLLLLHGLSGTGVPRKTFCVIFSVTCGLYYKHVTIVYGDSSVISKWSFKHIDDTSIVIYDHHRFIIQANGPNVIKLFPSVIYEYL